MTQDSNARRKVSASETPEVTSLSDVDLKDLCRATVDAIIDGQGFSWLKPPAQSTLEAYWRGVLMIPDRSLFVARFEGSIVGTVQLVRPPSNNETGAFAAELTTFFIAPWARGHGLARSLLRSAEDRARSDGFTTLEVHVRTDRQAAITLAEASGFTRWATKERYARIGDRYLSGHYYVKYLDQ